MSIETEITRISTNVSDTLSAVSEMGGEVPEGATSDDMANSVRSIPIGAKIDDTAPSTTTTYSSQKIEDELSTLNAANAAQNTEIAKKANDAELSKVAKSGSYSDLTNKPTIPTVPSTLPNPNKLILSGAVTAEYDGSAPVSVEIPSGGGSAYELPIASATQLGGVQPAAKTDEMTQAVGVDAEGKLWSMPWSSGTGESTGGGVFDLLIDHTCSGDEMYILAELETPRKYCRYYMIFDGTHQGTAGFFVLTVNGGTGQWKGDMVARTFDAATDKPSPWILISTVIPNFASSEQTHTKRGTNLHYITAYRITNKFDPFTTEVRNIRIEGQNMAKLLADAGARFKVWGERCGN